VRVILQAGAAAVLILVSAADLSAAPVQGPAQRIAPAQTTTAGAVQSLPDLVRLVRQSAPAVVSIFDAPVSQPSTDDGADLSFEEGLRRLLDSVPDRPDASGVGSGFIVSEDGYILTAAHVVQSDRRLVVRLDDRREFDAEVVGADARSDVALLRIDARDLPFLALGRPDELEVGQWVLAIGSPFGFERSATAGIVSAKGRNLPSGNYVPYIQTDVPINPGNSGGPLLNLSGEVVGLNSQIYSRTGGYMGLSFSVPIDLVMSVADHLREHGHVRRGWLGVRIRHVTAEIAEFLGMDRARGALVADVLAGSPATEADLIPGDVIIAFNDRPVLDMPDLPPLVAVSAIGEPAELVILRQGEQRSVRVRIGELPESPSLAAATPGEEDLAGGPLDLFGMQLRPLSAAVRATLGVDHGILVDGTPGGEAAEAGVEDGDVIVTADGIPVYDPLQFLELAREIAPGRHLPLLIRRAELTVELELYPDEAYPEG